MIRSVGHPRAPDRVLWCGMLGGSDFFGEDDTWMDDAGHEEFARRVRVRLRIKQ